MIRKLKYFLIIGVVLCLVSVSLLLTLKNRGQIAISEIADLESYINEYDIVIPNKQDIYTFKQDDYTVILVDTRNPSNALYTHSDISAKINKEGILFIDIEDRTTISESDISGSYGVIIQCDYEITDICVQNEKLKSNL